MTIDLDARVGGLAARQHGVVSRNQLEQLGVAPHVVKYRLSSGRWECLAPNVYRLQGAPDSWLQRLMTAHLSWGAASAISHSAAAALRRLAGFDRQVVELTVPKHRRGGIAATVHRNVLDSIDVEVISGIPLTTTARTIIDLAATVPIERVEEALDDALRRGLVSVPRVRWRVDELERGGRRRGIRVLRTLLDSRDGQGVPQSVLETRLLRVLASARLPRPVLQHRVKAGSRTIALLDFAFPEQGLAIETDGYRWHSGRAHWAHDRVRSNQLTQLGWRILHVTWDELANDPDNIVRTVRELLD